MQPGCVAIFITIFAAMATEGKQGEKERLHIRNKNREKYNLEMLTQVVPELDNYITYNKYNIKSVDFSNPVAVKLLNKALLLQYYGITYWEFPNHNLCPPIPGRADYIHYIADLIAECNFGRLPEGNNITCLDVGVGASCIYPILGVAEYNWNFIGTDINPVSIASSENIISNNKVLNSKVECRLQKNSGNIFYGVLKDKDIIDVTICNPPFHASAEEAQKGTLRKVKNLSGTRATAPTLNFAGINNELVYKGGERRFIQTMIEESRRYFKNCFWFTTLVSKQSNLKGIYKALEKAEAKDVKTIPMGTGNKSARIVAWTFLSKQEQQQWKKSKWQKTV